LVMLLARWVASVIQSYAHHSWVLPPCTMAYGYTCMLSNCWTQDIRLQALAPQVAVLVSLGCDCNGCTSPSKSKHLALLGVVKCATQWAAHMHRSTDDVRTECCWGHCCHNLVYMPPKQTNPTAETISEPDPRPHHLRAASARGIGEGEVSDVSQENSAPNRTQDVPLQRGYKQSPGTRYKTRLRVQRHRLAKAGTSLLLFYACHDQYIMLLSRCEAQASSFNAQLCLTCQLWCGT
jgi:hypothetical protein